MQGLPLGPFPGVSIPTPFLLCLQSLFSDTLKRVSWSTETKIIWVHALSFDSDYHKPATAIICLTNWHWQFIHKHKCNVNITGQPSMLFVDMPIRMTVHPSKVDSEDIVLFISLQL